MNNNIVIPALYLFQILPKFREKSRHLMTVLHKPRRKKVIISAISIKEKAEIQYADIQQPSKNIDINNALLQIYKQKLVKNLEFKGKVFYMTVTIWNLDKKTKYTLSDCHVKADQGSDLVTHNPRLVKRLRLKVRPIITLALHHLSMSVANKDFTELKSSVKFWVKVSMIHREGGHLLRLKTILTSACYVVYLGYEVWMPNFSYQKRRSILETTKI